MSADNDTWKWWYYVIAGALILAYGLYQISDGRIGKGAGGLILGVLAIAVGFFSKPKTTS